MIDVGAGVEQELGISRTRLDTALDYLEKAEGCAVYGGGIPQPTNSNQQTNQKVLCLPGTKKNEIYEYGKVKTITEYTSNDDGETYHRKFTYPESLDSKRLQIRYENDKGPDGFKGIEKDGIIELRPGVQDLSLGNSKYAQVRIMVDGKMVGQTVVRPYGFAYIGASLTQIDLPANITSIGMWAFVNDVYLRLTELPSGLTVIGANAFNNCSEISITEIPSGVTSIGPNAFIDCVGLTSIRFLGTPTSINATAFRNCTNIKEIKVPWSEGAVANAPWGAINATITYDYTGE